MKITANLKRIIVQQFRDDASMEYLAKLYALPLERVEGIIRDWMRGMEANNG
jgi:hypothetical protein